LDTLNNTSWRQTFSCIGGMRSDRPSHARRMSVVAGRPYDQTLIVVFSSG
jgi:hypothetical protein